MSLIAQLLQKVMSGGAGVQQNAQAALPVIPNNGNPQGANNMPTASVMPDRAAQFNAPSWLAPSASMDLIHQMLTQPLQQGTQPRMGFGNEQTAPLMPMKDGMISRPDDQVSINPIMPQRNHMFRDMRNAMREEGDFAYMPKRGQRLGVVQDGVQQMLPVMPQFRGNERF